MGGLGLRRHRTKLAWAAAVIAGAAVLVLLLVGHGRNEQGRSGLFVYNRNRPLDARLSPMPDYAGDKVQAVAYNGDGGDHVPGLLATPPNDTAGPCVLFMHGLGQNKDYVAPLVAPLGKLGIALLAIDEPDQGARGNRAELERVLHTPTKLAAMLRQTVIDMRRGLDFLQRQPECDPRRLGVFGFSLGALDAVLLGAIDTRVKSTVLLSTGAVWPSALREPGLVLSPAESKNAAFYRYALRVLSPYGPERWIGRIAPRPVLIINGRYDKTVPFSAARVLDRAAGTGSQTLAYDGGHAPTGIALAKVLRATQQFFERTLVH